MIPHDLSDITEAILLRLKDEQVSESHTIDYKRESPKGTGLVEEACSFANAAGGDLFIGVADKGGIPVDFPGIEAADLEQETLRFDQMIANGMEPQLRGHVVQPVQLSNQRYVFVIRIPPSLNAPHRVTKSHRFFGRTSAGKFQMDIFDLRAAFLRWDQLAERIKSFRDERIDIIENNPPVSLPKLGPRVIVHIIPQEAFARPTIRDAREFSSLSAEFRPFEKFLGCHSSFNADGFLTSSGKSGDSKAYTFEAYTQIFRTGAIELVGSMGEKAQSDVVYLTFAYESQVIKAVKKCLAGLRKLDFSVPFYLLLSLTRTHLARLTLPHRGSSNLFDCNRVIAPEVELWQPDNLEDVMRPAFNVIANAAGYSHSLNYSESGEWNPFGG